jgi:hypothetical protein
VEDLRRAAQGYDADKSDKYIEGFEYFKRHFGVIAAST